MIDASLKDTLHAILDGAAELEETELSLDQGQARIQIGLYPQERGLDREPDYRRLALSGLKAVCCWTGAEELPAELRCENPVSPLFMNFVASLFANQWLEHWNLFADPASFLAQPPSWSWQASADWQQAEALFLRLQRAGDAVWTLGLWFDSLEVETPLETRQTLKAFVDGWEFMAKAGE